MVVVRPRLPQRLRRRNARVQEHLALVEPVARYYAARSPESCDDLRQVALLGLIQAAERYRCGRAVPFEAFARPHIRGAVLHYLRDVAPLLRPSRRLQERQGQLRTSRERLRAELGREASAEELKASLGLSERQWQELMRQGPNGRVRVDAERLAELPASPEPSVAGGLWAETGEHVIWALGQLPRRQRELLEAVVLQGRSLRSLARDEGISATSLHRLFHRGLEQLRRLLSDSSAVQGC